MASEQSPEQAITLHFNHEPIGRLGVAVSGGSDSLALLVLLHDYAARFGGDLEVVTLDHGLRAESADEARYVARICEELRLPHAILHWTRPAQQGLPVGTRPVGNLMAEAREARYRLISDWAKQRNLPAVALGHTLDDQAETVLMRLGRGAGVDGLSAMPDQMLRDEILWRRPLLKARRGALQQLLRERAMRWCDDPTNYDGRYDRIKAREILELLAPLGVTAHSLSQTADNMRSARRALREQSRELAQICSSFHFGALRFDTETFRSAPIEAQRRLLIGAVSWLANQPYPPRRKAVERLLDEIGQNRPMALGGCMIVPKGGRIWVAREVKAQPLSGAEAGMIWDDNWHLKSCPAEPQLLLAPLGMAGVCDHHDWRVHNAPQAVLAATPALWKGGALYAAPLVGETNGVNLVCTKSLAQFIATL